MTQFGTYLVQLTLEWARLSQYTRDDKYRKLAEAAALKIINNVSPTELAHHILKLTLYQPAPLPGELQASQDEKYSSGLRGRSSCTKHRSYNGSPRRKIYRSYNLIAQPAVQLTALSQSWGGGSDSYFEYLIKYARLSNTANSGFVDAWLTAVDSSIKYLKRVSFAHPWSSPLTHSCRLDVYSWRPCVLGGY